MSFEEKLNVVLSRHEELEALLGSGEGVDGETYVKLSKELANLKDVVAAIKAYQAAQRELTDAEAMMKDESLDADMKAMAEEEFYAVKEKLPELEREVRHQRNLPKMAIQLRVDFAENDFRLFFRHWVNIPIRNDMVRISPLSIIQPRFQ